MKFPVVVAEGTALAKSAEASSWLNLESERWIKNVVEWDCPALTALMMASLNRQKSVHIDDVCGQIREG